ncbi:MAG: 6-carboxytetrahydropterin synthase QueD [Flavobacteriales bacterium]|nr:6-carboxytetrahydropterin synthase QueD [Flavobacteriales bacterium]MCL4857134.1 6-carboxytetrahydropterin synthase QueD [Flavobacteriales bacterium]
MSVVRVTKQFHFEMAHALLDYDGPCKNIHGHSYQLNVTVKGNVKTNTSDSDEGMVVDFGIIKKIVKEMVVDVYDHALVLNQKAKIDVSNFEFMNKLIRVPYQPTCENMLVHFADVIKNNLPAHIQLHSLFLRETNTSFAEWFAEDN